MDYWKNVPGIDDVNESTEQALQHINAAMKSLAQAAVNAEHDFLKKAIMAGKKELEKKLQSALKKADRLP